MADFDLAWDSVASIETDFSNDYNDSGNWASGIIGVGLQTGTKYGVTSEDMKKYLGRNPTLDEMRDMPLSIAKIIMKTKYWQPMRGDEIKEQPIANKLFNQCYNEGEEEGIILMQRAEGQPETGKATDDFLNYLNNI